VVFCCGRRSRLGRHQNGGYWLLDVVRGRANPGEIERLLRDGKRVRIGFGKDPGQAGNCQALHLARWQYGLYNIDSDFVQMPPFEAFRYAERYYASLANECTH
jgi:phage terminase large subunit-like protein